MGAMITHQGRIVRITGNIVTVAISPEADECGGCAVGLLCGKNEKLDVNVKRPEKYSVGEAVTVGMRVGMQRKGTLLFFVMPIFLLISSLAIAIYAGAGEGASALIAIGTVIAWYGVLYACRVKIRSEAEVVIID